MGTEGFDQAFLQAHGEDAHKMSASATAVTLLIGASYAAAKWLRKKSFLWRSASLRACPFDSPFAGTRGRSGQALRQQGIVILQ